MGLLSSCNILVEVLGTITELRSGRHLPAATMADQPTQPTTPQQSTPTVILTHLRDPGTFCGTDNTDVEDWLAMYERVCDNNRWDPTMMLANLMFYLKGTAKQWYDTHEADLTSWDVCKEKMRDLFGRPVGRQLAAKKELACRAQTSTESYVVYIQDVLALCRKADNTMTEADKIGHILKGIADDAFNLLMCKDCATVDAIIKECRRFEQAKGRRVPQHFDRLPNTAATSSCADPPRFVQPTGSEDLTRIVRRELEAMAPAPIRSDCRESVPAISLIQAVVREEIASLGIPSLCSVRHTNTYQISPAARSQTQSFPPLRRNPADWRTPDDRPICFNCSGIGHIARHCRNRWSSSPRWSSPSHYRQVPDNRTFSPYTPPRNINADSAPPRSSRSPSPQGRRSRSPLVHRSSSPSATGRFPSGN